MRTHITECGPDDAFTPYMERAMACLNERYSLGGDVAYLKEELSDYFGLTERQWARVLENSSVPTLVGTPLATV